MNNEPVAWMVDTVITYSDDIAQGLASESGKPIIPLYTNPAKTLTDEEITQVFDECYPNNSDGDVVTLIDFARAILKKASEK